MAKGESGLTASNSRTGFHTLSDSEEQAMYDAQNVTARQQAAFDRYTDPNTEPGSLYNFSQNMNMAVANDQLLSDEQQEVWDEINGAMHPLGQNVSLSRYDHADTVQEMLNKLGYRGDAETMSVDELAMVLVGVSYTDKRILSTSVNDFKNASDPSTFTSRKFKFTYEAESTAQGVLPGIGNTPFSGSGRSRGDDFGEMLLGSSNEYTVKTVRLTGKKARAKGMPTSWLTEDQIEIVVGAK